MWGQVSHNEREVQNRELLKLHCSLLCSIMEWWEDGHRSARRGKLQQLLHSGESMTLSRLRRTLPGPSSSPQKRNTESSAKRRPTIRPCAHMRLLFFLKMRHLFIFPILTPPAGVFFFHSTAPDAKQWQLYNMKKSFQCKTFKPNVYLAHQKRKTEALF